jgi:ATP-binding cassette subfamily B protein
LFSLGPVFIQLVLVLGYLCLYFDYYYICIILTSILCYAVFTFTTSEWRTTHKRVANTLDNQVSQQATDALINFETVKYFSAEVHETTRYASVYDQYRKVTNKVQGSLAFLNIGQQFFISLGTISVQLLLAYQAQQGERTVGDFVMLNSFIFQLYAPLSFLGVSYRMIKTYIVDVESILALLEEKKEINDRPNCITLDYCKGNIEFRAVSFGYSADSPMILNNVSFFVKKGTTTAIVGPTGAGKSTIVKLLYRLYDVNDGAIFINDIDIRNLSQTSLRKQISIVPQDCSLFNTTLAYNIGYGCAYQLNFDKEPEFLSKIQWASQHAKIDEFVERQPKKYDTIVGERGLRLSGGEKQRVSIARALLKKPSIMCFDEATSSLDTLTEREIQKSLDVISKSSTTVVIAHRLSTIIGADQILVLKDGHIVESGTHESLLAMNGEYFALWAKQSSEEDESS